MDIDTDMDIADETANPRRTLGRRPSSPRPLRRLRFWRTPRRRLRRRRMGGEDMMRARRMLAQGDLRLIALALDRRSAAPRLRDHQAGRGEDRGLVLAEPRHRLSDADLSRRSRLCHRFDRRLQRSSTPSPTKAAPISKPIATSSTSCSTGWPRSASASTAGAATRAASARIAARCRRWSRPTLDHLRETVGKRLENDAEAEARLVEILARTATELQKRARLTARSIHAALRRLAASAAPSTSGVWTCSGRMPRPSSRAGMRRSSGKDRRTA